MADQPLFADLPVSRPRPAAPSRNRAAGIIAAAAFHVLLLGSLVLAPFLLLEVMVPPRAMWSEIIVLTPFRPAGGGDRLPQAAIRQGTEGRHRRGSVHSARRAPVRRAEAVVQPDRLPVAPPEANPTPTAEPAATDDSSALDPEVGPVGEQGHPLGTGDDPEGDPKGCAGCIGKGRGDGVDLPPGYPDIFSADDGRVTQPVLIPSTRALPAYPEVARRARVEGTVVLMIVILADGSVGEIEVIRSPDPLWGFDLAAVQSVRHWRYTPALMHGRPVAVYAQVMVEFTISR